MWPAAVGAPLPPQPLSRPHDPEGRGPSRARAPRCPPPAPRPCPPCSRGARGADSAAPPRSFLRPPRSSVKRGAQVWGPRRAPRAPRAPPRPAPAVTQRSRYRGSSAHTCSHVCVRLPRPGAHRLPEDPPINRGDLGSPAGPWGCFQGPTVRNLPLQPTPLCTWWCYFGAPDGAFLSQRLRACPPAFTRRSPRARVSRRCPPCCPVPTPRCQRKASCGRETGPGAEPPPEMGGGRT